MADTDPCYRCMRDVWMHTPEQLRACGVIAADTRDATIASLTAELQAAAISQAALFATVQRVERERDEARARLTAELRAAEASEVEICARMDTALSRLRRVRGWRVVTYARTGTIISRGPMSGRAEAYSNRDWLQREGMRAKVVRIIAKARG